MPVTSEDQEINWFGFFCLPLEVNHWLKKRASGKRRFLSIMGKKLHTLQIKFKDKQLYYHYGDHNNRES